MKFEFWFVGKTTEKYLDEGIQTYLSRIQHHIQAGVKIIPSSKESDSRKISEDECRRLLALLKPTDFLVLLDERGKQFTSIALSSEIEKWMHGRAKNIVFLVGGAFGVNDQVRERAGLILSASKFTFTHQMIRLILMEQIYRAFSIIKGEKYHHE